MDTITIDFETYYSREYSLSKLTTEEYINSPLFEVIGVAVKVNANPTEWFSGSKSDVTKWLSGFDWANSMVIIHNGLFDAAILAWQFNIYPKAIVCTLCMGRGLHGTEVGNSLAKLSAYYNLGAKGTEVVNALGKRRVDFTPGELAAYSSYCINDVDLTYALFNTLLPMYQMSELKLIDMTIKMFTTPTLVLDADLLSEHLDDVITAKDSLLERCGLSVESLMSNDKLAAALTQLGIEPPTKISLATGKTSWAFAKTDEVFKDLLNHDNPDVQAIVAARLGVKSTLEESRTMRFLDIARRPMRGAYLPVPLKYYGAVTGRFAGEDKINLQNITRGSKLKQAIKAPPGKVIVGADLSNIELRVGLWYAGQMDKLELLSNGIDLYKDFATSAFGVRYEDVTKDQRQIAKTACLSLLFATGHVKLRDQVKLMSGIDLGEDASKRIVALYREEYPKVVEAWKVGGQVLECISKNNFMEMGQNGLVKIMGAEGATLPSGMFMRYPDLTKQTNLQTGYTEWLIQKRKNQWERMYGGKVFQGHTQALARCVMTEAMLRIAKKYPIALTIHDAIYCVVPEIEGETALDFIITEMRRAPTWLPGIVLDAEGGFGPTMADV